MKASWLFSSSSFVNFPLVLVCHDSSLVSSSFVMRLAVSSDIDVNRETTSKDIKISSGSSLSLIRPNKASTTKFYGLPKIHKENIPLRPIVSLPGSPSYELSKYLAMILQPLVKTSPHTINNTNSFLTNNKDLKLVSDEILISFDVVSLFTSIPLDTAKRITNELLTNDESSQTRTKLDKHDILELLDLCLSTEFSFQNCYYRQISGTPMGSPLSSFLAEAVMQDLETRSVTNNNDIKTWNRYVDDILAAVKGAVSYFTHMLLCIINLKAFGQRFQVRNPRWRP